MSKRSWASSSDTAAPGAANAVARRHVFAVALEREDGIVLREVLDRDLAAVVVQRDEDNAFALGSDRLHQLVERNAFELHRALEPGGVGLDRNGAERFQRGA